MPANTKRVFYVKYLAHSIFAELLGARADIRLDRLENESSEEIVAPVLAAAHAFQIGAARDELSHTYHVDKRLLARMPNLLIVSSNGAGYDTVDVPACTDAGVLVLNQSGGNRQSVAEHVLAMLLTLSKRIVETDRIMRRQEGIDRNVYLGNEFARQDHRHRRPRPRREPRGRAVPRSARHAGAGLRPLSFGRGDGAARRRESGARCPAEAAPTSCRSIARSPRRRAA